MRVFSEPFNFLEAGCSGNHGKRVSSSSSSSSRPVWCLDCNRGQHPASSEVSMIVLDKIRAFFKWYGKGMGFLEEPNPEAKGAGKRRLSLLRQR